MRKGRLLVIALAVAIPTIGAGGAYLWTRGIPGVLAPLGAPACRDMESWDACQAAPHCNAGHIIAAEGYEGPIWECVPAW